MAMNGSRSGPASGFSAVRSGSGSLGFGGASVGALRGICLGGPTSAIGDGTFGRHLAIGILRNNTEGNPAQPSLQIDIPNFFRLRWSVQAGSRLIQVNVKQAGNYAGQRPTMIVKASTGILSTDQTATAGSSTGWIVLGPITFTALAAGALWVELWNNDYSSHNNPCYFDHLVAT